MKTATLVARVLLGLIFVMFGLNGFLHFLPQPPLASVTGMADTSTNKRANRNTKVGGAGSQPDGVPGAPGRAGPRVSWRARYSLVYRVLHAIELLTAHTSPPVESGFPSKDSLAPARSTLL